MDINIILDIPTIDYFGNKNAEVYIYSSTKVPNFKGATLNAYDMTFHIIKLKQNVVIVTGSNLQS